MKWLPFRVREMIKTFSETLLQIPNEPHRQEDSLGEFSEGNFWTQRENKVKALVTFKSLKIFCGKAFKQCQNLTDLKPGAQKLQSGTIKHSSPQKPLATYSVLSLETIESLQYLLWHKYRVGPCIKNAWYICNHIDSD